MFFYLFPFALLTIAAVFYFGMVIKELFFDNHDD